MKRFVRSIAVGVLLLLGVVGAFGHDLGLTVIRIERHSGSDRLSVTTALSAFIAESGLPAVPSPAEFDLAVRERLSLANQGQTVTPGSRSELALDTTADVLRWSATLPKNADLPSVTKAFGARAGDRTVVLRQIDGGDVEETVMKTSGAPRGEATFIPMVLTGVEHIWSGLDHLLFVFGLALVGGSMRNLLKAITAFALAHTTTILLTALAGLTVSPRIVEPLIALSIVLVAFEAPYRREKASRFRTILVFAFGLVHGLGFAGGLTSLGVDRSRLVPNLIGFNLGIELGQFAVLLAACLLIGLTSRLISNRQALCLRCASVALGMVGAFWFAERLI